MLFRREISEFLAMSPFGIQAMVGLERMDCKRWRISFSNRLDTIYALKIGI
jgi:hypothetical protein